MGWHQDLMLVFAWVVHCDIDCSIWHVFHDAGKKFLKGSAKEDVEQWILHNVGMDFEGDIANVHVEVLSAAKGPAFCTIHALHLQANAGVDVCRDFISQVFSNSDDL